MAKWCPSASLWGPYFGPPAAFSKKRRLGRPVSLCVRRHGKVDRSSAVVGRWLPAPGETTASVFRERHQNVGVPCAVEAERLVDLEVATAHVNGG